MHPLGVEGALLLARALGLIVEDAGFARERFFGSLRSSVSEGALLEKLRLAEGARGEGIPALGNGIEALESVPTALACFATWPDSFTDAVGAAILLGGDTDTIGAMTGALSGARLGVGAIPRAWLSALEDDPGVPGRSAIRRLADELCALTSPRAARPAPGGSRRDCRGRSLAR